MTFLAGLCIGLVIGAPLGFLLNALFAVGDAS